jgi:hypothetical protein
MFTKALRSHRYRRHSVTSHRVCGAPVHPRGAPLSFNSAELPYPLEPTLESAHVVEKRCNLFVGNILRLPTAASPQRRRLDGRCPASASSRYAPRCRAAAEQLIRLERAAAQQREPRARRAARCIATGPMRGKAAAHVANKRVRRHRSRAQTVARRSQPAAAHVRAVVHASDAASPFTVASRLKSWSLTCPWATLGLPAHGPH